MCFLKQTSEYNFSTSNCQCNLLLKKKPFIRNFCKSCGSPSQLIRISGVLPHFMYLCADMQCHVLRPESIANRSFRKLG